MRILDRYVASEAAGPFFLSLGLFTLILLVARIVKLIELIVNRGVPFLKVLLVFSYILPSFLEFTVPMALLLAALVALGRMSADSEITAMSSAGLSLGQFTRPILVLGALGVLLTLGLATYVRPWANARLRAGLYDIAKSRAAAAIQPRVFSDDFSNMVIYVDEISPPGNVLRGILISGDLQFDNGDSRATASPVGTKTTVIAKSGILAPNESAQSLDLRLSEGSIHSLDSGGATYQRTDFSRFDVQLDIGIALSGESRRKREPKEMALPELRRSIDDLRRAGAPHVDEDIELHRRLAIPFACLGFVILAIPLGIQSRSNVRTTSLLISLAAVVAYYALLTLGESIAERGQLPVPLCLWMPNAILALVGLALFRRGMDRGTGPLALPWRRARSGGTA